MAKQKAGAVSMADWSWGLLVFAVCASLFVWRLAEPSIPLLDEADAIASGQSLFAAGDWRKMAGVEPAFAPRLIGAMIALLGDNPFGWRIGGALLGGLTVACVYGVMRLFGFSMRDGLIAAGLTLCNQSLFVTSRMASAEIYMIGFFSVSVLMLVWSAKRARTAGGATLGLVASGASLGLAIASGWMTAALMGLVWGGVVIWRFTETSPRGAFAPRLFSSGFAGWRRLSLVGVILRQVGVACVVFGAAFLPLLLKSGYDWQAVQSAFFAYVASPDASLGGAGQSSDWWAWPTLLDPAWLYRAMSGADPAREVISVVAHLGSPVVYWCGLPAMMACLGFGMRRGDGALLAISSAYFGFWLVWAAAPGAMFASLHFEFAALMLGMGIVAAVSRLFSSTLRGPALYLILAIGAACFAWFYPVLAAIPVEADALQKWIWFPVWR